MKSVPNSRYYLFLGIALVGLIVDLVTKDWAFDRLGMPLENPPIQVVDGIFSIDTSLNEGALFGIGQGLTWLFATLSFVAATGIVVWLFWFGAAIDRMLTIALASVMGGTFGNLYDRFGLPGLKWNIAGLHRGHEIGDPVYAVRDFFHFKVDAWNFDWPIFNVADMLLVCGAGMLILHAFCAESTQTGPNDELTSEVPLERQKTETKQTVKD